MHLKQKARLEGFNMVIHGKDKILNQIYRKQKNIMLNQYQFLNIKVHGIRFRLLCELTISYLDIRFLSISLCRF